MLFRPQLLQWVGHYLKSLQWIVWNVLLWIDTGLYKGAKLKAEIRIPRNYPEGEPTVVFLTKVYHPLVKTENQEVDLEYCPKDFGTLRQIPLYLYKVFLEEEYFEKEKCYNEHARDK